MPEHYNNSFYDQLDDLNNILGSTLNNIEEKKENIVFPKDSIQSELKVVQTLLENTYLTDAIPVLDKLITNIAKSIQEESKVYSDIEKMIQSDKAVLVESKTDINNILIHLENEQKQALDFGETLLDHLEEKLGDINVIIFDTFYS
jgi:hypothetical protein